MLRIRQSSNVTDIRIASKWRRTSHATISAAASPVPQQERSTQPPHHKQKHASAAQQGKQQRHAATVLQGSSVLPAVPSGPGLPLLLGLKQLPGGAQGLLGWRVLLAKNNTPLGTVEQVQHIQPNPGAPSCHLLRVHQTTVLQPYGFKGREVHALPLVPDIIAALHPKQRVITVTPPQGLLDLGRRELLLSFLSQELMQYATPLAHPAAALQAGGQPLIHIRVMPSRQQLLSAGRSDLVGLIGRVGGFTQAALLLGLRAARRPVGYWDSLEVMDAELDAFIAGSWLALPVPEDEQPQGDTANAPNGQQQRPAYYYYNTATRSIRWELPAAAQSLLPAAAAAAPGAAPASSFRPCSDTGSEQQRPEEGDQCQGQDYGEEEGAEDSEDAEEEKDGHYECESPDDGDDEEGLVRDGGVFVGSSSGGSSSGSNSRHAQRALLALADERVMPSQNCVKAAGRWDLHHAIVRNGGYLEVAQQLSRRLSWPVPLSLKNPKALDKALAELAREQGWGGGFLPSMRQLREADRHDVIKSILYHGGRHATAELLQLQCRKPPAGCAAGSTAQGLAEQLLEYMVNNPPPDVNSSSSSKVISRTLLRMQLKRQQRQQQQDSQQPQQPQARQQSQPLPNLQSQQQQQQQQQQQAVAAVSRGHQWSCLPTQVQLLAAGRPDLAAGLQKHGHDAIRVLLGLPQSSRKRLRKGVLNWEAVESAVRHGCHMVPQILAHITEQQQQQDAKQLQAQQQHHNHQPQQQGRRQTQQDLQQQKQQQQHELQQHELLQQQQQQRRRRLTQQDLQQQSVPLVSREHLVRQLKVWVDEGRLVKPVRGEYHLP